MILLRVIFLSLSLIQLASAACVISTTWKDFSSSQSGSGTKCSLYKFFGWCVSTWLTDFVFISPPLSPPPHRCTGEYESNQKSQYIHFSTEAKRPRESQLVDHWCWKGCHLQGDRGQSERRAGCVGCLLLLPVGFNWGGAAGEACTHLRELIRLLGNKRCKGHAPFPHHNLLFSALLLLTAPSPSLSAPSACPQRALAPQS